jgi:hypothetical protein
VVWIIFFFVVLYCKSLIDCKAVHENVLVIFMQLFLSHVAKKKLSNPKIKYQLDRLFFQMLTETPISILLSVNTNGGLFLVVQPQNHLLSI